MIEYASVVYGTLLTVREKEKIEKLQKSALSIVYGFDLSYLKLLNLSRLETLEDRSKKSGCFSCTKNTRK